MNPTEQKKCSKCKEDKLATTEYFYPMRSGRDWPLQGWCRLCVSSRNRRLGTQKLCRKCGITKSRTSEFLYRRKRIDSICRECRKRSVEEQGIDPDLEVKKFRENQISTQCLFEVVAKVKGEAEAGRIVNEERASQGLPPMDYVGDIDIVSEDVEAFSILWGEG